MPPRPAANGHPSDPSATTIVTATASPVEGAPRSDTRPGADRRPANSLATTRPNREFVIVPVFYATDRTPVRPLEAWIANLRAAGSDYVYFGRDIGPLQLGLCTVSIPAKHTPGEVERPSFLRLEVTEDITEHVTLRGLRPLTAAEFIERISAQAELSAETDAFVFIHGFNVKFNDAAMRAAQIAYDFGFKGAPILYSWSSDGAVEDYNHDTEAVHTTEDTLYAFLDNIVLKSRARKIHLVAHSMGNRALMEVLKQFARNGRGRIFSEVIFAAPDIGREHFVTRIAPFIGQVAGRVTLYASSDDRALKASNRLNSFARLGQSKPDVMVLSGIDSIDASGIDTDLLAHSYFANAEPVINDLTAIIRTGARPDAAPRQLLWIARAGLGFWKFRLRTNPTPP